MMSHTRAVERQLDSAESRLKVLRLIKRSAVVGSLAGLAALLFGLLMLAQWVTTPIVAGLGLAGIGLTAGLAWLVMLLVTMTAPVDTGRLAQAVERAHTPLLDRLNTLVFLRKSGDKLPSYADRIEGQAVDLLREVPAEASFPETRAWLPATVFFLLLVAVISFYLGFKPWTKLRAWQSGAPPTPAAASDPGFPMPPAEDAREERDPPWGEVRISEPGRDLRVNRLESVTLQIEAAANRPLQQVEWFSAVNGGEQTRHPLPSPDDPRYAVYRQDLQLEQRGLADWDVLVYYAQGTTADGQSYESEMYFLEVLPLGDELDQLPGGVNGAPYRLLNDLTEMMGQQQEVIRQTRGYRRNKPQKDTQATKFREHLAQQETDLGSSARHLSARVAGEFGAEVNAALQQELAAAETSFNQAARSLREDALPAAQRNQRHALARLAAARKSFSERLRRDPQQFAGHNTVGETPADSAARLAEMRESRAAERAAADFLQQAIGQQQNIARRARARNRDQFNKIADQQDRLRESLDSFRQQHPSAFEGLQPQAAQTTAAMDRAADSLRRRASSAQSSANAATDELLQLADQLSAQSSRQQLADAYQLQELLDEQSAQFDRLAQQPESFDETELQERVQATRETLAQLQQLVEQPPAQQPWGPQLRDALNEPNQRRIDGL